VALLKTLFSSDLQAAIAPHVFPMYAGEIWQLMEKSPEKRKY
jgi:hypothetical protein